MTTFTVNLVGPRGEDLGLTAQIPHPPGPTVAVTTTDGRVFFYDQLMSTDTVAIYREYVELN